MRNQIEDRARELGNYMIENNATVRSAAGHFQISKSTVHKDISVRLKKIDPILYRKVKSVMDTNRAERHIRGGDATRRKYLIYKKLKNKLP